MSQSKVLIAEDDTVLKSIFATEMTRQIRAIDTYGTYDNLSVVEILEPFVLTKEMKREIPVIGDPDEIILSRVKGFYNAIASMIERECGLMAVPLLNLSYEGFGRVIITVGKLVVVDKSLRDVHRFGFPSLAKMKEDADKILMTALGIIGEHGDVANL